MALDLNKLGEIAKSIRNAAELAKERKAELHNQFRSERQCTAVTRDGLRCRAWSVWGDPSMLCSRHGGKRTEGRARRCAAYRFPHRRRSGLCNFPNEPLGEHPAPAGKRKRSKRDRTKRFKAFMDKIANSHIREDRETS